MGTMINSITFGTDTYPLSLPYGVCEVAAGTVAKTVTVDNFYLEKGASVIVKFTYANTAANPTLKVNDTEAKPIYWHGAALASSQYWQAGATLQFVYNGTQWELMGIAKDNNNTYTVNNAKITIAPGTKLTTGGNFTANQSSNKTITINHADTTRTDGTATAVSPGYAGKFTVVDSVSSDTTGHVTGIKTKEVTMPSAQSIPTSFNISATATDDDVVVLTGSGGANSVSYDAKHAKKGPTSGYTSGNTVTSISGSGASKTIKIPQITVDNYGHVTAAADESITITMPTIPTNHMIFKGTLGTEGTVTALPTSSVAIGHTYKVITAGTYASTAATVGDLFVATATTPTWVHIPSGDDEYKGTVTKVSAGAELTGGNITTTGTIAHATKLSTAYTSGNTTTSISGSGASATIKIPQLTVNTYGHVTAAADESITITMPTLPTSLKNPNSLDIRNNGTSKFTYDGSAAKILDFDNGTNTTAVVDTSGNVKINVPTASGAQAGVTIVYPEKSCTTFSSDSGTVTPLAVQKGAKMFAITRPQKKNTPETTTDKAITRWQGTNGDVQDSTIIIEDVTNDRDGSAAQVLAIPASGGKKMVYGYCTDQTDGTSFIGGVFPADATSYPYADGLAIGGTSGNLLWKGKQVATTDQIPTDTNTTKVTAGTGLTGGGSAASSTGVTLNVGAGTGISVTADAVALATYGTASTYGPSANAILAHSGTFTVPKITTDAYGRVTASNITYTLPASGNTDTKVKCTALTTVTSGTETLYPVLMCSTASPTNGTSYEAKYNTGVKISNYGVLMGAAWNDYAEYRNQEELIEPGYCVKSADNGKVSKTTEKYAACDGIVSDTFGFSIGKTDTCQTPLAVAGRVLAYFEGNREDYHAGDTVCAGPNGKIMKMTREEIKEYPDRIIGLVSEIPEYETWGTGNVSVNGRIWIKIR